MDLKLRLGAFGNKVASLFLGTGPMCRVFCVFILLCAPLSLSAASISSDEVDLYFVGEESCNKYVEHIPRDGTIVSFDYFRQRVRNETFLSELLHGGNVVFFCLGQGLSISDLKKITVVRAASEKSAEISLWQIYSHFGVLNESALSASANDNDANYFNAYPYFAFSSILKKCAYLEKGADLECVKSAAPNRPSDAVDLLLSKVYQGDIESVIGELTSHGFKNYRPDYAIQMFFWNEYFYTPKDRFRFLSNSTNECLKISANNWSRLSMLISAPVIESANYFSCLSGSSSGEWEMRFELDSRWLDFVYSRATSVERDSIFKAVGRALSRVKPDPKACTQRDEMLSALYFWNRLTSATYTQNSNILKSALTELIEVATNCQNNGSKLSLLPLSKLAIIRAVDYAYASDWPDPELESLILTLAALHLEEEILFGKGYEPIQYYSPVKLKLIGIYKMASDRRTLGHTKDWVSSSQWITRSR